MHGTTAPVDPATGARDAVAFAMYHPAFALYQASNRQTLIDDIRRLPAALIASRQRREPLEPLLEGPIEPELQPEPEPEMDATASTSPTTDDATPQLTLF